MSKSILYGRDVQDGIPGRPSYKLSGKDKDDGQDGKDKDNGQDGKDKVNGQDVKDRTRAGQARQDTGRTDRNGSWAGRTCY